MGNVARGSGDNQSYSVAMQSGTMAAGLAAGAEVVQVRWTSATLRGAITSVRVWAGGITAFTAGFATMGLVVARAFTANGTGGNTATLTTNNGKRRTGMAVTALGSIRVASTAALGAGTKTLDATSNGQAFSSAGGSTTATAGAPIITPYAELIPTDYPLILAQDEGFSIIATVPATGTWTFGVDVRWSERLA